MLDHSRIASSSKLHPLRQEEYDVIACLVYAFYSSYKVADDCSNCSPNSFGIYSYLEMKSTFQTLHGSTDYCEIL